MDHEKAHVNFFFNPYWWVEERSEVGIKIRDNYKKEMNELGCELFF
jgi:hypothetical protein